MLRHILHFRIDAFPAAVERIKNPSLRHRPVAVCPRHSPRSLVFSASAEARHEGVFEGMPLTAALKRCPALVVLPPDEPLYRRAADAVAKVLGRYAPVVEPGHWGRFHADLSGTGRLFGGVSSAAFRILRDVERSVRFDGTAGLASNKLVSGVASRVVRSCGDLCEVPTGSEASFLAPLSVRLLPAVRHGAEGRLLFEFNIRFVEQLAGIPVGQLVRVFGKFGLLLHRQAFGIDEAPVRPPDAKPFIFEEETLAEDTNDDVRLLAVLYGLTERACRKLRSKNILPRTAWLHVRYSDGVDATRRLRFTHPSSVDPVLFRMLEPLFLQTGSRRQRVRYMGLTLTDLFVPPPQLDLFEASTSPSKEERLVR
ncbi:MAG TPA: DNA polymerase IV, partial [bacterium]